MKKKFPWIPLIALALAYAATYNAPYIRYYLYDSMIEAIGCTNIQLAFLTTVSIIASITIQIPGGWVADKYGAKKCIVYSVAANFPLCILAAVFSHLYWVQVVVWASFGITGGFAFWPAVLKGVRVIGGKDHQETTYGIFESAQGLIATATCSLALVAFSLFSDHIVGYKMALSVMGAFCLVAAILVGIFFKDGSIIDDSDTENTTGEKKGFAVKDTIKLLKNPGMWLVAICLSGVYGLYVSQSYLTPYFTNVLGASVVFTGFFAVMRDAGTKVIAGPLGGIVAKKIGSASILNGVCLIICAGIIFVISKLPASGASIVGIATAMVLASAIFCVMAKGTMWATMSEANIPMELTGTAIAIITMICIYIPDSVLPLINGYLLDKYADNLQLGYTYYFSILIGLALMGSAAAFANYYLKRKRAKAQLAEKTAGSEV